MGGVMLEAAALCFRYSGAGEDTIRDVSVAAGTGELLGIVGPNGSGKTTLVRLLLGVLKPTSGTATVHGRPAHEWPRSEMARIVAVVAQREEPLFPIRVRQAVLLGRYPHMGALGAVRAEDRQVVAAALERCDVAHLADRWVATLSGGEWQRVRIARAVAQAPGALVLDEATANLDVRHEMETLELVAQLVRENALAGVVVTHHVNLAARFVDRITVLDRGEARATGAPREVLTRETLEAVFRWPVEITSWRGTPQVVPLRSGEPGGGKGER
jgi:iron complex transport system ATP-binding protein